MAVLIEASLKQDFESLIAHFGFDCSDIGDLDEVARLIAFRAKSDPNYIPDHVPPWFDIYETFVNELEKTNDHDLAWLETVKNYSDPIKMAIRNIAQYLINQHVTQGLKDKRNRKTRTKEYASRLKKLGFEFFLNQMDDSIYVTINGGQREILGDILFSVVYRALVDNGMNAREGDVKHAINVLAYQNIFHPIQDYLDSLAWDGQPHIQRLAEHFADAHGVFPIYLRRWLIGAVARVYTKGVQNSMLVLDGPQGIGKSFFSRWLIPMIDVFNEGPIQPENKDDQVRQMTVWIWEVKELGATFRKADMEALKSFLTLESVRVRKPYGHYDLVKPAITSFIGTINNVEGFLSDPTGSRRFNIVQLISIDWAYKDNVDRDQVWAEARAAYLAREPWMLTSEEQKIHDQINEEYAIVDPVEDALLDHFEIDTMRFDWWTSTAEIIQILEDTHNGAGLRMGNSRATAMAVARVMKKLGCKKNYQKKGVNLIRGYLGIRRKGFVP